MVPPGGPAPLNHMDSEHGRADSTKESCVLWPQEGKRDTEQAQTTDVHDRGIFYDGTFQQNNLAPLFSD